MLQFSRQTHANTDRHDDPCDEWVGIGCYIRAEVERVERAIEHQRNLREFCDADAEFARNYTQRWR